MNTAKQDYYTILEVERGAAESEIKAAYRKLTKKYHPDIAEDKVEAEKRFKEINEAYAVLSDPEKRSLYDQFGHDGVNSTFSGSDFMGGFGFGFGDIFSQVFDIFDTSSRNPRNSSRARRGADLRYDIEITLEEAFKGVEKDFTIEVMDTCQTCEGKRSADGSAPQVCGTCRGTGQVTQVTNSMLGQIMRTMPCHTCHGEGSTITNPCKSCKGEGRLKKPKTIKVAIPAGVETGSRIRLNEEGEAGYNGGRKGDLYVVILVQEHKVFQRSGSDLFQIQQISFSQAALGSEIEIPTIDGKTTLKIPQGTQCDTILKVPNQGMPYLRSSKRGDLYVKVWVMVPQKLNEAQKAALKEFDKLTDKNNLNNDAGFFEKLKTAFKKAIG